MEGEVIAGMTLGWNFGDGHLHHEGLVNAIQSKVNFSPSELIVIMVEPQSLGGREIRFRVVDAALGEQRRGSVPRFSSSHQAVGISSAGGNKGRMMPRPWYRSQGKSI